MERTCKLCGESKPLDEFVPYITRAKRGYRHVCYPCWNDQWREVQLVHQGRYYHLNQHQQRDKGKERARKAYYAPGGKEERQRQVRLYDERHPDRRAARRAIEAAVRYGKIKKQPCAVCGTEKVDAHHDDYSRPLDVIWLCRTHHGERHRLLHRGLLEINKQRVINGRKEEAPILDGVRWAQFPDEAVHVAAPEQMALF